MELVDRLWAIEQIKQLRARYFRYTDTRQTEKFLALLTDDVHWEIYDSTNSNVRFSINGKAEFMAYIERMDPIRLLPESFSVHHGHMPEIEIIDENNARGVFAKMEYLNNPGHSNFIGYGYWHDEYRRDNDGTWLISKVSGTWLHIDALGTQDYGPVRED